MPLFFPSDFAADARQNIAFLLFFVISSLWFFDLRRHFYFLQHLLSIFFISLIDEPPIALPFRFLQAFSPTKMPFFFFFFFLSMYFSFFFVFYFQVVITPL